MARLAAAVDEVRRGGDLAALDGPIEELRKATATHVENDDGWGTRATIPQVVGDNLGRYRREAGWTQDRLAGAMTALSFPWNRQTVAETERAAKRRTSVEELLALAALFGVPALRLMEASPSTDVVLNDELDVPATVVGELLVGRDGSIGTGGHHWLAAAALCSPWVVYPPSASLAERSRSEMP